MWGLKKKQRRYLQLGILIHDVCLSSLTLARAGKGGDATPMSFSRIVAELLADRAEILHSLWGILCATFGKKKMTGSGQVTEL